MSIPIFISVEKFEWFEKFEFSCKPRGEPNSHVISQGAAENRRSQKFVLFAFSSHNLPHFRYLKIFLVMDEFYIQFEKMKNFVYTNH